MKAAIFSNHSPRVGFGVDRKKDVSRSQVMVVAASRNHLYRRRLQVVIDAGPRNHLYLLGQQVKIRSSPRIQDYRTQRPISRSRPHPGGFFALRESDPNHPRDLTNKFDRAFSFQSGT